ncbi:hypothetical protein [Falsiroseomonas sp. HW251]
MIAGAAMVDWIDLNDSFAAAGLPDIRGCLPDEATTEATWRGVRSRPRF